MSRSWKRVFVGDSDRPPSRRTVLVSADDQIVTEPLSRIADFLEWSKPLLEKAVGSLVPASLEVPLPKNPTFSVSETAKALKLHHQTVANYCRQGVFGKKMPNGKWRISKSEIEHWLKGQHIVHGRRAL